MSILTRYDPADIAGLLDLFPPTDEQAAVICAPLQPGVVIAGAGSGKTETMAARVVWLIANDLVAPDRILGLTFTRKAAGELLTRIRLRLRALYRALGRDPETMGEPTVLTYAAYAGRLVEEYGVVLGVESGARLLTEAARWQAADTVVRRYDGDFAAEPGVVATVTERTLDLAGQLADHLREPADVRALSRRLRAALEPLPPKPRARIEWPEPVQRLHKSLAQREDLLPLVERFAEHKRAAGVLDFADQMVLATRLAQHASVTGPERAKFDAVLLDEYQDTGHAQIEMLAGLFGDGRPVTAVGDPMQSIYSWRGASAGNIHRFADRFRTADGEPAPTYRLMTSWRNDDRILGAANRVSAALRPVDDPALRPRPDAPAGQVVVSFCETVETEAAWLAGQLRAEWDGRTDWTAGRRTLAVLVRKRSAIALIAQAVREVGLPVEVVDLGGLLTLPEIADLRAVLQVLADHHSGASLARLLTGARWRLGAADLVALHDRARALAALTSQALLRHAAERPAGAPAAADDVPADRPAADPERVEVSLVEAVDDLGDPQAYSAEGYRRLEECGAVLRRLRRRMDLPLPDLIAEIERALGLDVEVLARGEAGQAGRANLDRFIDEAARFTSDRTGAGVSAFLGYLRAAEQEEYGLKPATTEVQSERVQILTVHGSKGLEWDVVAIGGLIGDSFPDAPRSHDWASTPALLPSPLRGDHAELPPLTFLGCEHRGEAEERIAEHRTALSARHLLEERRLAYVAFTRARHALFCSGAAWGAGTKHRSPSVFLTELAAADGAGVDVDGWFSVDPDAENPLQVGRSGVSWPADPLGGRRETVAHAAELVRQAMAERDRAGRGRAAVKPAPEDPAADHSDLAAIWRRDVDLLLAERAAAQRTGPIEVAVPGQLSVSDVVAMAADPAALARRLRRPLPQQPARHARRGTAFHTWLEQRWSAETLLDLDELPGAVDEAVDDRELEALKTAFDRSRWGQRTPVAVEVPFEMSFGGRVVRGRMDAVFADPDGGFTVVDWKTGRPPAAADGAGRAVQLAVYRLAWAALQGIADDDLDRVRAAFHYVRDGLTVAPDELLDAPRLRTLINGPAGGR